MLGGQDALHLTLTGKGISIDRDVPEAVASQVIQLLLQESPAARPGGNEPGAPRRHEGGPATTLAEMFVRHEPKRNPDKIAVIAFHAKAGGKATFQKADVRAGFRGAGEREPANFDRDWQWAVRNGWLGGNAKDGFYITRTGEEVVRANFAREHLAGTKLRSSRKAPKASKGA